MTAVSYQCGPRVVTVVADPRVRDGIDHYLRAQRRPLCPPDTTVTVRVDPPEVPHRRNEAHTGHQLGERTAFTGDIYQAFLTDRITLVPSSPGHVVDLGDNTITVHAANTGIGIRIAVRVLRQITMRAAEDAGARALHAGAVVVDGRAVLVGGRAGAGKTTMLLQLIKLGAAPMASDRTMVTSENTHLHGTAVPHAWRITPQGLESATELHQIWQCPQRGQRLADGKAELTPVEIADAYDRPLHSASPVSALVLVDRTILAPAISHSAGLRPHLDFGNDDPFAEDWLTQRRTATRTTADSPWWNQLTTDLPTLRIRWTHPQELALAAAAADTWIRQ
ncbi:MAG: hypothetical protein H5T78_20300 [Nocardia sp.]|nr:hypothetical protein [Nocardia sp.]